MGNLRFQKQQLQVPLVRDLIVIMDLDPTLMMESVTVHDTHCSCLNCFDENACKDALLHHLPRRHRHPLRRPLLLQPLLQHRALRFHASQSDCPTDYVLSMLKDAILIYGDFDCNCYKGKPTSDQPGCCGGTNTFPPHAWCAKQGTKSATKPVCSNHLRCIPRSRFTPFMNMRCVKDRRNAGFCDNPKPKVVPYYGDNDTYVGEFTCAGVDFNLLLTQSSPRPSKVRFPIFDFSVSWFLKEKHINRKSIFLLFRLFISSSSDFPSSTTPLPSFFIIYPFPSSTTPPSHPKTFAALHTPSTQSQVPQTFPHSSVRLCSSPLLERLRSYLHSFFQIFILRENSELRTTARQLLQRVVQNQRNSSREPSTQKTRNIHSVINTKEKEKILPSSSSECQKLKVAEKEERSKCQIFRRRK